MATEGIVPSFGVQKFYQDGLLKKPGYALVLGCGRGDDGLFLAQQGYVVDAVDSKTTAIKERSGGLSVVFHLTDVRRFTIDEDTYSVIVANDVLPFIGDKEVVANLLARMAHGLASEGLLYFTLFGTHHARAGDSGMSFFGESAALDLIVALPIELYYRTNEEGYVLMPDGSGTFVHFHRFLYVKK